MTGHVRTSSGPVRALTPSLVLTLALVLVPGCRSDPPAVAELLEHQGAVETSAGDGSWSAAEDGDRFPCEHALRTASGAWARIAISGSGRARLEPETTVHFRCKKGQARFDIEVGVASIQVENDGAAFDLEIGRATLSGGGEFQLRNEDGKTRLQVVLGTATIELSDGSSEEIGPGQSLGLEFGRATIERAAGDLPPDAGADDGAMADAGVTDGSVIETDEVVIVLRGRGSRSRAPGSKRFAPVKPGEYRLAPGTELRLGRRARAALTRGPGEAGEQATLAGSAEVVIGGPGDGQTGELLTVRRGTATLRGETRARVPGGAIALGSDRAEARVTVDRRKTRVRALRGKTDVEGKSGGRESLQLGERVTLSHAGRIELYGRAPARAHVVVTAGESPTIHDPRPPTAVAVDFAEACGETGGEGVVEVAPRRSFTGEIAISKNTGQANVLLDAGRTHFYRVRCLRDGAPAEIVARGRLRVVRDRATKRLPKRPPRNTIDADGRLWTVLYQNALPEITFVWPRPTGSGAFQLHISRSGGETTITRTSKSSHRMASGKLEEGTYQFFFQRGARPEDRSRTSTLRIEFDNAAPSAFVRRPGVSQAWTGDSLEVAGTALPGSSVSVAGTPVDADRKGRFSTTVSLPTTSGIVAIRTAHPRAGVHYYLRRKP